MAATLEEIQQAARDRIAAGTAEAGDYKLLADELGIGGYAYPKLNMVQTNTQKGTTTTESEQEQKTNRTGYDETTTNSNQSAVSYKRMPGIKYDKDGNIDQASVDAMQAARDAKYDAATSTLANAIGVSQDKIRENRERQMQEDAKRAKMAELVNASRLVSDMVSAAAGGSVYERQADTTAKEAYDNARKLRELQAAEDAQAAQAKAKLAYDAAISKIKDKDAMDAALAQNVSSATSNGSNKAEYHSGTDSKGKSKNTSNVDTTTTTRYDQNTNAGGGGSSAEEVVPAAEDKTQGTFEGDVMGLLAANYERATTPEEKKAVLDSLGATIDGNKNIVFPNGIKVNKSLMNPRMSKIMDEIIAKYGDPNGKELQSNAVRPSQRTSAATESVRPSQRK